MKRILHILPQFQPGGGMERVVMNYFNYIDSNEFRFDVLTHRLDNRIYADRIEHSGGKVFVFPPFGIRTLAEITRRFDELLSTRHYDVVHCHMANAAFIYLRIAQKHGVPLRILHSHQDHYADVWSHAVRNVPLVAAGRRYANYNIACSKAAGDFLFKDKQYTILKNGIDVNEFCYSDEKRQAFRNKLGISNKEIIFAYVGRLVPQKNPIFMLDVFSACLKKSNADIRLVIAGSGELEQQMRHHASDLRVDKKIIWLGDIDNVSELDSGIDVLLMPSLYEGLGLSLIEAQCAGACCFASDTIPIEAFATHCVESISLKSPIDEWAAKIVRCLPDLDISKRYQLADEIEYSGYNANASAKQLMNIYEQIS